MTLPHTPPLQLDGELPAMSLDEGIDAFCVEEVPSYLPSGEGPHWYIRVRKKGLTTQQAIASVARAMQAPPREIGVAGQKDRNAVTTQWMSVPAQFGPPEIGPVDHGIEIVEVSRHLNKLRVGHVAANRFELRFSCNAEEALGPVESALGELVREGMRNYFGPQRFGRAGGNVAKASAWARGELRLRGREARFKTTLYASVLQSEVFNRYLTARMENPAKLLEGEVVRLDGNRSVFVVEDVEAELARLYAGDIHLTGPMVGPKCRAAAGVPRALEDEAKASLELDSAAWEFVARNAQGTRRDLLVVPMDVGLEVASPGSLVVRFTLPAGSYATQLARELTRAPWERPLRQDPDVEP